MINRNTLSKIGIGAWGIGGFSAHDIKNNDELQIQALVHSLKRGINYVVVNYWNSEGYSLELIKEAIRRSGVARENLFLVQPIYEYNYNNLDGIEKEFNYCLEKFETSYIDSVEFALPAFRKFGFENLVNWVEKQISDGRARYTSLTNCNLEYLQKYHQIFKDKLFSHEVIYNFEIRINETLGITTYASRHGILNVLYQPIRRNRTAKRNWSLLVELSKKYSQTQNQIIFNWLVSKGFLPVTKSETISHIDENLGSLEFEMEKSDLDKLNSFTIPGYKIPEVDWWMTGEPGLKIHMLPNVFDETYPNNF